MLASGNLHLYQTETYVTMAIGYSGKCFSQRKKSTKLAQQFTSPNSALF